MARSPGARKTAQLARIAAHGAAFLHLGPRRRPPGERLQARPGTLDERQALLHQPPNATVKRVALHDPPLALRRTEQAERSLVRDLMVLMEQPKRDGDRVRVMPAQRARQLEAHVLGRLAVAVLRIQAIQPAGLRIEDFERLAIL